MIPHPLLSTAAARPDHVVLRAGDVALTARELLRRVERRASGLRRVGIVGPLVALRGPADAEFVITLHALGWLGLAVLPLPWKASARDLELAAHADQRLGHLPGALPWADDDAPCPPAAWPLEQVRLSVATSGTTGRARLVPLTTLQLLASAFGSAIRLGHLPSDRWVCALPLHHVGGLSILFRCAWYGTTVELHERFDAEAVDRAIDQGAALVSVVPTMLERLLDARRDAPFPGTLRALLLGGAAPPEALLARCRAIGAPVARSWGMTEAASQVATTLPGDLADGYPPLPFVAVDTEDGRLRLRGPLVGGELLTADRGHVIDGRVFVLGRADDVIVSGGENIDPAVIEQALARHPSVREVAVVGVPDPVWGQRPVAHLVGDPVPDAELAAWCRERLARWEVPDRFVWRGALPRNALGKVVRRLLQDPGEGFGGFEHDVVTDAGHDEHAGGGAPRGEVPGERHELRVEASDHEVHGDPDRREGGP